MTLQGFLLEHGRLVQMIGTAVVVLTIGWISRRAQPRVVAGWTHSHYPLAIKALSLLFLVFMTAATLFNGLSIFKQDWWVVPVFLLTVAASYLFAYEVFFSSLRWNEYEVEVRRFPFRPRRMKLQEITMLRLHATTESVTLSNYQGARLWFPYGYRAGAPRLFGLIRAQFPEPEA